MKVTNKMQLYRLIYFSLSALHVSGDVFAHYQGHLTVFTVSDSVHPGFCRLVSWMSWNWCRLIYFSLSALHVSGDFFPQSSGALDCLQYLVVFTQVAAGWRLGWVETAFHLIQDTSRQQPGWTLPDSVNTVKCSWWWGENIAGNM